MRIVVACLPAAGHRYPVMPLAEACRDAGHDVLIATGPEPARRLAESGWRVAEIDADTATAAGQLMRSGMDFRKVPPHERWRFGSALFAGSLAGTVLNELSPVLADERPDVVLYEEMNMGAALAAGLAGVPAVRHGLGPWLPPDLLADCRERLTAHLAAAGRPHPSDTDLFGVLHLDIWPAALAQPDSALPLSSMPARSVAWNDPELPVPPALTAPRDRPLVYLTLGTVNHGPSSALRMALDGLAGLDVDVLAAVGPGVDVSQFGPTRSGISLVPLVAGAQVVPAVDLVVHHGGGGTTLAALAASRPQLVLPQVAHDQFISAAAVSAAGVGTALMPPQVSATAVAAAAAQLLAGHDRGPIGDLAAHIAQMPAPADLVPILETAAKLHARTQLLTSGRATSGPVQPASPNSS